MAGIDHREESKNGESGREWVESGGWCSQGLLVHECACDDTIPLSPLSDGLEFLTLCLSTVHHVGQVQLQQSTVHMVAGLQEHRGFAYQYTHIHVYLLAVLRNTAHIIHYTYVNVPVYHLLV